MPKLVDAGAQRQEIRAAARAVFARRGVTGTGLTHVAEVAGMGRSSLYHYYPDKDALLRDLVREMLEDEEALFRSALHGEGSPLTRIERLTGSLVSFFDTWSGFARMLFDLRLREGALFRPFFRRVRAELAGVIAEGQRAREIDTSLDPALAASTLIGAIDGLLFQYSVDRSAFPDLGALGAALCASARRELSA
jgi:AcrR family transcriptional regulator